jgi:hypothetical protein
MAQTAVVQLSSGNTSASLLAISILAQVLTLIIDKLHRTLFDRLANTAVVSYPPIGG